MIDQLTDLDRIEINARPGRAGERAGMHGATGMQPAALPGSAARLDREDSLRSPLDELLPAHARAVLERVPTAARCIYCGQPTRASDARRDEHDDCFDAQRYEVA